MSRTEQAARFLAEQIDREFFARGENVSDAELARWVRERQPAIPEHVAREQVLAYRDQGDQRQPGSPRAIAS